MQVRQDPVEPQRKMPPPRNPSAAWSHAGTAPPPCSAISIPGASSDQKLAATMTPPANPSIPSRIFRFTSRARKTALAPSAVTPHVNSPASSACIPGCNPLNIS